MKEMVVPTETPIRVFVSGRQSKEHEVVREIADATIRALGFVPWLFEHAPASDLPPEETFLNGVESSDIFFWITKGTTSPAVDREVRRALKLRKLIYAFFVETNDSDEMTRALKKDVRMVATTREVKDENSLGNEISIAMDGLIARSIRHGRLANLSQILNSLKAGSIARCYGRFVSVQIQTEIASEMASDISIGKCDVVHNLVGVAILVGEMGAGKTLAGERAHQNAINKAQVGNGPFPIWCSASSLAGSIEETVRKISPQNIDLATFGIHLVIDGLDEANLDYGKILLEAQSLCASWRDSTILITARPREDISGHPLSFRMPKLTDEEVIRLASLTGRAPNHLATLSVELRDAVHRPLFALLLGSALKANFAVDAPQALVTHLVSETFKRHKVSREHQDSLVQLAIKMIDRKGSIPVVDAANIGDLLSTGLIEIEGQLASFSLSVVEQWFAAKALRTRKMTVSILAKDQGRILLWTEAIAMAIAGGSEEIKNDILSEVAHHAPELFAWLISEAIPTDYKKSVRGIPTEDAAGKDIRTAMKTCVQALGNAAVIATPVNTSGLLPSLGIRIDGTRIAASWYQGKDDSELAEILRLNERDFEHFPELRFENSASRSGWAWRFVLTDVRDKFKEVLEARRLPVAPQLQQERDWIIARAMLDFDPSARTTSAYEFLKYIEHVLNTKGISNSERVQFGRTSILVSELESLQRRLPQMDSIEVPWPLADKVGGSFIEDNFSDEQLEARIRRIFTTAMEAHRWYSETVFKSVSTLAPTHGIRPARCEMLVIRDREIRPFGTSLVWAFEPLNENEPEQTKLSWQEEEYKFIPDPEHWEQVRAMRPSAKFFGHSHHQQVLDIFGLSPTIDLVYDWLTSDLKRLGWVD